MANYQLKILDMATRKLVILLTILVNMYGIKAFAYDIAMENSDGVTIYYNYCNDGKELEVVNDDSYFWYSEINIPSEVRLEKTIHVTSIGEHAFFYCSNLASISIPTSITSIGVAAFEGCTSLTSIDIPNSVSSIGRNAFYGCKSLRAVTIPSSVSFIDTAAFYECRGLSTVTIENGLTSISDCCFSFCSGLTTVTLPNSIVSIGKNAFSECTNLPLCIIPNSVKTIGSYVFYGCKYLKAVVIGSGCEYIDYNVFGGCFYMEDVYCYAKIVPNTHNAVFGLSYVGYATLHVLDASLQDYKDSSTWSKFAEIVPLIESDPKPTKIVGVKKDTSRSEIDYFSLNGEHLSTPRKGINIVIMSDGTVLKKIFK